MFGGVDRGGGREGKGKSLRKNKIALEAKKKNVTPKFDKDADPTSLPVPPLFRQKPLSSSTESGGDAVIALIDAGCNLVSRRFENDQSRVIQRAIETNIEALVVLTNDCEKQEDITQLMKEHRGFIYGCVGIHPDNVKRANDKLFAQKIDQLKEAARQPETVAIFSGLDFSREVATRYAQERLFQNHVELAIDAKLPLLFTDLEATEKLVEVIREFGDKLPAVALFNFSGTEADLEAYLTVDNTKVFFIITGMICDSESSKAKEVLALLPRIPPDRLILASDSPKYTPQNIEDPYIRKQKNEPSNLPFVLDVVSQQLKSLTRIELAARIRENTMNFLGLRLPTEEEQQAGLEGEKDTESEEEEEEEGETGEDVANKGDQLEQDEETAETREGASATDLKYACVLCRTVLLTSKDIIPHEKGLDSLKDFNKRARTDIEYDSSNVVFARELPWMKEKTNAPGGGAGKGGKTTGTEGKLDCPKCGSKAIGRWVLPASSTQPIYTLKKKRVEAVLEGIDAKSVSRLQEDELLDADEEEDGKSSKTKKARRRKQQKATNTSNMGNFRNKSYGVKSPAGTATEAAGSGGGGSGGKGKGRKQRQRMDDDDE